MRRVTKLEIIFGLITFLLIYSVLVSNASITGFVVAPSITLVSPASNVQTEETSIYFMFKYSPEFEMKECSLILNDEVARIANALLSPYDTRIRVDLMPGRYIWRIECIDTSDSKLVSETRHLIIDEKEEESELKVTSFPNRPGLIYEFELKPNLELEIKGVMPNDVIRVKKDDNTYDMNVLRLIQDYSRGTEVVDLLITPGNKRMRLDQGDLTSIDFNNDNKDDLYIVLNDISYKKALFTVSTKEEGAEAKPPVIEKPERITSPVEEIKEEVKLEEKETTQIPDQVLKRGILELAFIGFIIILIIAIISQTMRKKEEEEKKYLTTLKEKTSVKLIKEKVKKKIKKKAAKKKVKKKPKKKKATKKKVKKKK